MATDAPSLLRPEALRPAAEPARTLPDPFFVLASQNPIELEGTYPLPEAQLDRFLFKLVVTTVEADVLDRIISTRRHGTPPVPTWRMSAQELAQLFGVVDRVFLP